MIKLSVVACNLLAKVNVNIMNMELEKIKSKNELNITYAKNKAVVQHSLGYLPENISVSETDDRDIIDKMMHLFEDQPRKIDLMLVHKSLVESLLNSLTKYDHKDKISVDNGLIGTIWGIPFYDFTDEYEMWKIITDNTTDGVIPNYRVLVPEDY